MFPIETNVKMVGTDWLKAQGQTSKTNIKDKCQTLHSDWLSSVIGKASMCSTDVAALSLIGDPANALTPLKFTVSGV